MERDCPCDGILICRGGWIWSARCWLLNICPECEQTWMTPGEHWPVSTCAARRRKSTRKEK